MLNTAMRIAAGLFFFAATANADNLNPNRTVNISFNQYTPQLYGKNLLTSDWHSQVVWGGDNDRAQIMQDTHNPGDKHLRVKYPVNAVGPWHSGTQFLTRLPAAEEYWVTYKVRFQEGFDFKMGGKLPGLASGDAKYAGGIKPWHGDGWTARLMWLKDGSIVPYLYYVGMPKESHFGHYWKMDAKIQPGQWHEISQRIRLNSAGKKNGLYEVWFDGKLATQRRDMVWRYGNQAAIDAFLFSTFHGGASLDWAPRWNSFADFDDIRIDRQAPARVQQALLAMR